MQDDLIIKVKEDTTQKDTSQGGKLDAHQPNCPDVIMF